MNLDHMKEFTVFARYLNMTKASKELLMTQSNLSKHLKQLEHELGFRIVDKSNAKLHLTHEGERFLNSCNSIIGIYEKMVQECRQSQMSYRGTVYFQEPSYSDATAEAYYGLTERLRSSALDVDIRYFRPYRKTLVDDFVEKKSSLLISYHSNLRDACPEGLDEQGFVAKELARDELVIWCDAHHPLALQEGVKLKDVCETLIVQPNDTYAPIYKLLLEYEKEYGIRFGFNMVESDRSATFLSMRHPTCIYMLPRSVKEDMRVKARKDMVFRTLEDATFGFTSYAVMKKEVFEVFPEFESVMM